MNELLILVSEKFPFELTNIIVSYLEPTQSAYVIKDAVDNIQYAEETHITNFFAKWVELQTYNRIIQQKKILDIDEVYWSYSLYCPLCAIEISLGDYRRFGMCFTCKYDDDNEIDLYYCFQCGASVLNVDNLNEGADGLYCNTCFATANHIQNDEYIF